MPGLTDRTYQARLRGLGLGCTACEEHWIKAALKDGLSGDRSGIDSNPIYRELTPSSKPRYAAIIEVWKAYVVNITKSSLEKYH
jgi:hypothetical protein